jgi:hypothetical protein
MSIFRKEKGEAQAPKPELPFEIDIVYSTILRNVLTSLFTEIQHGVKDTSKKSGVWILKEIERHPRIISEVTSFLIERTPSDIKEEYIATIAQAIIDGKKVVLLGPHWSVADSASFLKVVQLLNNYFKEQGIDRTVTLMGPASSKFFDYRMFASAVIKALKRNGIELLQIAQLQDKELRDSTNEEAINKQNRTTWRKILVGMRREGKILGIFQEGTRADGEGTEEAPIEVLSAIETILDPDSVLVPVFARNSRKFLGKGMPYPDITNWPTVVMAEPLSLAVAQRWATVIDCHPVDVARVAVLANEDQQSWGVLKPSILIYRSIMTQYGSLENYLDSQS